jgi:hypothetical protein
MQLAKMPPAKAPHNAHLTLTQFTRLVREAKRQARNFERHDRIVCTNCDTIVGTQEYFNSGFLLQQQNRVLRRIIDHLGVVLDYKDRDFGR